MAQEPQDDAAFDLTDTDRLRILRTTWPIFKDEPEYSRGYDAFLVVLRHIYSFVPTDVLPVFGSESLQALQVIRKSYHDYNLPLIKTTKRASLFELLDDKPIDNPASLTFETLVKNHNVLDKFWSRSYHLLYSTTVLALAPNSQKWVLDKPYEAHTAALESLFIWDGTTPLGDSLSALFGVFRHPSTEWRYLRLPGMPLILRVLYDPKGDDDLDDRADFTDARRFHVAAKDCEKTGESDQSFVLRDIRCQYRLVASVNLATNTVRLYGINGAYILPPSNCGELVNDQGNIGDFGRRYMLFYARTAEDARPQVPPVEVRPRPRTPGKDDDLDLDFGPYYHNDSDAESDSEAAQPVEPTAPGPEPVRFGNIRQKAAPALDFEDEPLGSPSQAADNPVANQFDSESEHESGPAPTQPAKPAAPSPEPIRFGNIRQKAPALDLEDDILASDLGAVSRPANKPVDNQFDSESEPEPEGRDNVHPQRRGEILDRPASLGRRTPNIGPARGKGYRQTEARNIQDRRKDPRGQRHLSSGHDNPPPPPSQDFEPRDHGRDNRRDNRTRPADGQEHRERPLPPPSQDFEPRVNRRADYYRPSYEDPAPDYDEPRRRTPPPSIPQRYPQSGSYGRPHDRFRDRSRDRYRDRSRDRYHDRYHNRPQDRQHDRPHDRPRDPRSRSPQRHNPSPRRRERSSSRSHDPSAPQQARSPSRSQQR